MKDHLEQTRRGAHAEREACRLIGAVLTADPDIHLPAVAALDLLPADLSDIGGLPMLTLEIIRRTRIHTAEGVAAHAMRCGVDIADLRMGSFMARCMDAPACQPEQAVQSVRNFAEYCQQLREVDSLESKAWMGTNLSRLLHTPDAMPMAV